MCYFDGRCGMCRRSTRILRTLDWLGRLEFVDMTAVPESTLPVGMEQAMLGMPMRTGSGRVLVGFPAVRRALIQTPLGCLFAWTLYVPGLDRLGAGVYSRIALHRKRDEVCQTGQHAHDRTNRTCVSDKLSHR